MKKRKRIDGPNDAGAVRKDYFDPGQNPVFVTEEYKNHPHVIEHPEKSGVSPSRGGAGTYNIGKSTKTAHTKYDAAGEGSRTAGANPEDFHPEKQSRTPKAADATTERRDDTAKPETHVYQNPIKLKTSQELGRDKKSEPVRNAVAVPNSAKRAIENQVQNDGNPKKR